jgi:hypothetical protein
MPRAWVCPRCGLTVTVSVDLKYPPTCNNHIGKKQVEMKPKEKR